MNNRVHGVEGAGLGLLGASRNQVANNTITDVTPAALVAPIFAQGNGSGVWVSPGSARNQILGNTFADVATYAAVLEGDDNHVATRSASDVVRDLGIGNRVTGPGSVITTAAALASRPTVPSADGERAASARGFAERGGGRAGMMEDVRPQR